MRSLGRRRGTRELLNPESRRVIRVVRQGVRRRMNDLTAVAAESNHQLCHFWCQPFHAVGRRLTPVFVPQVAEQQARPPLRSPSILRHSSVRLHFPPSPLSIYSL